jgi:hypothetical protein
VRRLLPTVAALSILGLACGVTIGPRAEPPSRGGKTLTFSILEDYDPGDDLDDVARDFALFKELEVRTWRGSFGWDDFEPERGRYDFAWLHSFIALADRHGITLRPYVAYTPEWAAGGRDADGQAWNQPPRDQGVWRAFVAALATELRHHDNVPSLEIYNEQNVTQWWEGSRAEYAATLATASAVLRKSGGLQILAGGLVYPDLDWVESVCATARDFDVLPVHAYPETWTPKGVTVENYLGATFNTTFAQELDAACGPKRIWINETGFATTPGKSEMDQATWWVRAIATFAAEPRVEHIGIYEIKDLAPDKPAIGDAPNYHLGLTRTDRRRKKAFRTVDMLTDLLDGELSVSNDRLTVERDGRRGELYQHLGRISEYSLDGAPEPFETAGPLRLRLEPGVPRIVRFASR